MRQLRRANRRAELTAIGPFAPPEIGSVNGLKRPKKDFRNVCYGPEANIGSISESLLENVVWGDDSMLLRRLTEHVKTQNWTAIALDFLIVVLGVLLAFQISAWNESRRAEVVRSAAIERLLAESEKSVQYLRNSVARFEDSNAKRADLLNRLSQDDWQDAKTDQMIQGIVTMGRMPPVAPPRSAYDEIIASGLFAEIGDAKSRESVTAYFSSVDYLNGMSEYMQTMSDWHSYWRSDSISEVFSPDEIFQTKTVLDVDALREDEEFQAILVRGHRVQLALTVWWRDALSDAETMCLELARYSNRRCTVLQAPK